MTSACNWRLPQNANARTVLLLPILSALHVKKRGYAMLVGLSLIPVERVVAFSARNTVLFFSANRVVPNLSAMDQNVSVNCISVQSVTLFSVLHVGRTMGACATRILIYLMIRLLGELSASPLARPPRQMSCRHLPCDRMGHPVVLIATTADSSHIDNDEFLNLGLLSLTGTSGTSLAANSTTTCWAQWPIE